MIEIFFAALIARSVFNNVATALNISQVIRKNQSEFHSIHLLKKLAILIPVLNETDVIEETIKFLRHILGSLQNVSVCIVGTAQERDQQGLNLTLERAKMAVGDDSRFSIIECGAHDGLKAHQLNSATATITSPEEETWILVLDVDSRFDVRGLNEFIEAINRGDTIIQQHAVFLRNIDDIGFLQKAQALYQSRWTLTHEMTRFALRRVTGWWNFHVVGHGLCINLGTLKKFGGFPEESLIEDVHLGYNLSASGENPQSIFSIETADCPATLKEGWKQLYGWSLGPMHYPSYFRTYRAKFSHLKHRNRCLPIANMVQGTGAYIRWLISSPLIFLLMAVAFEAPVLFGVWLLLYLLGFAQTTWLFWRMGYLSKWLAISAPALMFIHAILTSIPVISAAVDTALGRPIIKYKTTHHRGDETRMPSDSSPT